MLHPSVRISLQDRPAEACAADVLAPSAGEKDNIRLVVASLRGRHSCIKIKS